MLTKDKHSSLFCSYINDKEIKFHNIDTRGFNIKYFGPVMNSKQADVLVS